MSTVSGCSKAHPVVCKCGFCYNVNPRPKVQMVGGNSTGDSAHHWWPWHMCPNTYGHTPLRNRNGGELSGRGSKHLREAMLILIPSSTGLHASDPFIPHSLPHWLRGSQTGNTPYGKIHTLGTPEGKTLTEVRRLGSGELSYESTIFLPHPGREGYSRGTQRWH